MGKTQNGQWSGSRLRRKSSGRLCLQECFNIEMLNGTEENNEGADRDRGGNTEKAGGEEINQARSHVQICPPLPPPPPLLGAGLYWATTATRQKLRPTDLRQTS